MRAAGWTVVEYGPWTQLRAVVRLLAHSRRRQAAAVAVVEERLHLPQPARVGARGRA
jgi:hypothetical protein